MKRFAKAALALLLALALCVPAWAYNSWELPEDEAAIYQQLSSDAQKVYDVLDRADNLEKFCSGEDIWELPEDEAAIYQQLSSDAQKVYDVLDRADNLEKFCSGEDILLTGFTGSFSTRREQEQAYQHCFDAVNDAYSAILQNHPEIFWLSGISLNMNAQDDGRSFSATITVRFNFHADWTTGGRSAAADKAAALAAAAALADEACVQGGPYQQLQYVHDWLTGHNVYNTDAARQGDQAGSHLPWTPLSALTEGFSPVCEGYSRAFKLVCDELGYPCLYVVGVAMNNAGRTERHAWNQVMVGGKWYAVDVTFDDPAVNGVSSVVSGRESRDYFAVGEETLIDDFHVFGDSHFPDGMQTITTSFTYPALAAEALDPSFSWGADWPGWGEPEPEPEPEPDWPGPAVFADVDDLAYYAPAVKWAVAVGVTKGTGWDEQGNALFSPDDTVTRGQAVTFLWRAMGEPEPDSLENRFQDVAADSYYEKAVLWAVENGITNGTVWDEAAGVFEFSPDAPVTRGQMLTFLWRTMGRPGETDDYAGKAWNADAEAWAAEYGVADGTAEAYSAGAACPRGDVVYYLFHAVLLMAG